jgi:membrane dipeptidase
MRHRFLAAAIMLAAFFVGFRQATDYLRVHVEAVVVDTHNDAVQRMIAGEDLSVRTWKGHSDIPRLLAGGVDVQLFSIWVHPDDSSRGYYAQAEEQIDAVERLVARSQGAAVLARNSADIARAVREGKLAAMMGMEGGHMLEGKTANLRHFYDRGVRYMGLTWNNSTGWATSAKDEAERGTAEAGLTDMGKQVVREMNSLGMLVDVSHAGERTFWDVLAASTKPVIASHSSVWSLCPHRRNLKDDQIRALAAKGGVMFINFYPLFIDSSFASKEERMRRPFKRLIDSVTALTPGNEFAKEQAVARAIAPMYQAIRPPLSLLVDHIEYVIRLVGADHVGIGSDFDGITVAPLDMDDVTFLPGITRELLARGHSAEEVRKVLGGNFLRVLAEAERP